MRAAAAAVAVAVAPAAATVAIGVAAGAVVAAAAGHAWLSCFQYQLSSAAHRHHAPCLIQLPAERNQ